MPVVPFPWLIRAVLLALSVVCCAGTANARPLIGDGLDLPVCIAPAAAATNVAQALSAGAAFDCGGAQSDRGPGDYWALSAPIPAAAGNGDVRVRLLSLWQDALTLHALYADGRIVTIRTTSATLPRYIQLGAIVEFDLPGRGVPLTRLLWRIDGSANARGILLGQHIADPHAAERANVAMAAVYSGFVGLALALLVYNLAMWGALRHRFLIVYCAMVTALLVYTVSSSGALAWLWPGLDNNDRLRLNYISLGIAGATALGFARAFFEPQMFGRRLNLLVRAAIVTMIGISVSFWPLSLIAMPLADWLYSCALLFGLATIVPILIAAWRGRSDYLWLFAIAWAAPIVFALARVLAALHLLPTSFWLDNSTVLAMTVEALFSSLAIAYRIWMLTRERDEARAGETIARRLADTDPLTGLFNRRAFLAQAIGRAGPQQLVVIDIDHFKQINETLGHDGGDDVLRVYARVLRRLAPAGTLVARIGGEEFAVLCSADTPIDVERVLARLRTAQMPFDLTVTSSMGSCVGPLANEIDWKKLYHRADRALFDAKSAGRDRARTAQPLATAA